MPFDDQFQSILRMLDDAGLARSLRALPHTGGKFVHEGRQLLNFSSNDYLNLANDEHLKEGARMALDQWGCGATASRLMAGHLDVHEMLEDALAEWLGFEAALVLPTGFQTNLAVITALADEGDVVYSDALNHASIVDACRLARAQIHVYRHCDANHLEALLRDSACAGTRIVVTDSLFSMDGDIAPLADIRALCDRHGAMLIVDEAHAIGIYGPRGRGICAALGIVPDVLVGTLSKALGGEGGFAAGSAAMRNVLINRARSLIFSTGLAPACAGSAIAAIDEIRARPDAGQELLLRAAHFRERLRAAGVDVPLDNSQIIPLVVGANQAAVQFSRALLHEGILAAAVRPPSVPEGTARLRFSLTLAHTRADLDRAAVAIAEAQARFGIPAT